MSTMLWACTSGELVTGVGGIPISFAVAPYEGSSTTARAATANAEPVTSIRVTIRELPADVVMDQLTITVDPTAPTWDVGVPLPALSASATGFMIDFELLSATQAVQWSGQAGPLTIDVAGSSVVDLPVYPGPLSNFTVTSVSLAGPTSANVGQPVQLVATATTSDGSTPIIYWSSLDPTLAAVDGNGLVVGLAAGPARIRAEAGRFSAEHLIDITSVSTGQLTDVFYLSVANTELVVGTSIAVPADPHRRNLVNPIVENGGGLTATNAGSFSSAAGGQVTLEADGDFIYMPAVGFAGSDTFPLVTTGGSANVIIAAFEEVFYVDNSVAGPGTGQSNDPFPTIAQALAAPVSFNRAVFIASGSGPYLEASQLGPDDRVAGAGRFELAAADGTVANTTGTKPRIDGGQNPAFILSTNNSLSNLDIIGGTEAIYGTGNVGFFFADEVEINTVTDGVLLDNVTGNVWFDDHKGDGQAGAPFTIVGGAPAVTIDVDSLGWISTTSTDLLIVDGPTGGTLDVTGGVLRSMGGGGILLYGGSAMDIDFSNQVELINTGGDALLLNGVTGTTTFDTLNIVAGANDSWAIGGSDATGLVTVFNGSITSDVNDAIYLFDSFVDFTFSSMTVTNAFSSGIYTVDVYGSIDVATFDVDGVGALGLGAYNSTQNPFSVTVRGGVVDVGDLGMYFQGTDVDVTIDSIASGDRLGVIFDASTGTFSGAAGELQSVHSYSSSGVVVDYDGDIVGQGQQNPIFIESSSGTFDFSGSITDPARGIHIDQSPGAFVTMTGLVDVVANAEPALRATGFGSLEMSSTVNRLRSNTGTVVDVQDGTLGPLEVNLGSVDATGPAGSGIRLANVDGSALRVWGFTTPNSGGTIASANHGAWLTNVTAEVALTDLLISEASAAAVRADTVGDLTLTRLDISNATVGATTAAIEVSSAGFVDLLDLTVDGGPARNNMLEWSVLPGAPAGGRILDGTWSNAQATGIAIDVADGATARINIDGPLLTTFNNGIWAQVGASGIGASGSLDLGIWNTDATGAGSAVIVESIEGGAVCLDMTANTASVGALAYFFGLTSASTFVPTFAIERLNGGSGVVTSSVAIDNHIVLENPLLGGGRTSASGTALVVSGVPATTCVRPPGA